ncbi:Ger(x)C family spore germination protein [Metabacillus sp. Hm71]|uniref:Ger(x)C family spore germination protein n=1 Tax=Metabacillus sp. Hm71 TaxID=3450743 RepID=UPI003F42CBDC
MRLLILILSCFILTSCVLPERILEKQGVSTAIGFDLIENNQIKGTISLLQFDPNMESSSQIISTVNGSSKNIRQSLENKTSHDISSGQLRSIIFNEELAREKGIMSLLDTFQRDSNIGSLLYLIISKPSSESIITSKNQEDLTDIGTYLYRLIEKHLKREKLTQCTLHDFLSLYYEVGIDPTLPVVTARSKTSPYIKEVAVFKKDKMVGSISNDESIYLKMIHNPKRIIGLQQINIPKSHLEKNYISTEEMKDDYLKIMVQPIGANGKVTFSSIEKNEFNVNLSGSMIIYEMSEDLSLNNKNVKFLEKEISNYMENELDNLMKKLKTMQADPVGFGRVLKSKRMYSELTDEEWYDKYPQININTKVSFQIKRTGTNDK